MSDQSVAVFDGEKIIGFFDRSKAKCIESVNDDFEEYILTDDSMYLLPGDRFVLVRSTWVEGVESAEGQLLTFEGAKDWFLKNRRRPPPEYFAAFGLVDLTPTPAPMPGAPAAPSTPAEDGGGTAFELFEAFLGLRASFRPPPKATQTKATGPSADEMLARQNAPAAPRRTTPPTGPKPVAPPEPLPVWADGLSKKEAVLVKTLWNAGPVRCEAVWAATHPKAVFSLDTLRSTVKRLNKKLAEVVAPDHGTLFEIRQARGMLSLVAG